MKCTGFEGKRAVGIEPTTTAWKAVVLPLNYARIWGELNSPLRHNSISSHDDQHLAIEISRFGTTGLIIGAIPSPQLPVKSRQLRCFSRQSEF
jgi:hypothetical protein